MKNMTLRALAKVCGGNLQNKDRQAEDKEASCVVIDSRLIEPDGIFVAVRGEKVDGHSFIAQVAEKGALGVICEKAPENVQIPYILVEDSLQALKDVAEFYRKQLQIPVIGITGSVGKTSTKEMIAAVLSEKYHTLKTAGNFNNEIGLPLTVLRIREDHEAAVLEMGISDFGEMHRLSKIARPDICVLTNIGQCHLENLGSREGILRAKSEIFDFMDPKGKVFVNGDDDMLEKVTVQGGVSLFHFGQSSQNEVWASDLVNRGLLGSRMRLHMGKTVFPVEIPLPGTHMVYNALAAAAVGRSLGLSPEEIRNGIAKTEAVGGRSNVIHTGAYTVIDDCYNANPVSMRAALDLLDHALGRKVACLGDMFELGEKEKEYHAQIGRYAMEKKVDVLICTGELSKEMYEGALAANKEGQCYYFADRELLLEQLPRIIRSGDNVLVKASHGMQFDKVVSFLAEREIP